MFFNRRRSLDSQVGVQDNRNLTNYDEKTIFSTDAGGAYGNYDGVVTATAPRDVYTATTQKETLPMVFASRNHSDIYIYEYPDRLEYYVKASTQMFKFDTVKKQ